MKDWKFGYRLKWTINHVNYKGAFFQSKKLVEDFVYQSIILCGFYHFFEEEFSNDVYFENKNLYEKDVKLEEIIFENKKTQDFHYSNTYNFYADNSGDFCSYNMEKYSITSIDKTEYDFERNKDLMDQLVILIETLKNKINQLSTNSERKEIKEFEWINKYTSIEELEECLKVSEDYLETLEEAYAIELSKQ